MQLVSMHCCCTLNAAGKHTLLLHVLTQLLSTHCCCISWHTAAAFLDTAGKHTSLRHLSSAQADLLKWDTCRALVAISFWQNLLCQLKVRLLQKCPESVWLKQISWGSFSSSNGLPSLACCLFIVCRMLKSLSLSQAASALATQHGAHQHVISASSSATAVVCYSCLNCSCTLC